MAEECEGSERLILLLKSVVRSTAHKELMSLHELRQEGQAHIFFLQKSASLTSTPKPKRQSSFVISYSETRQLSLHGFLWLLLPEMAVCAAVTAGKVFLWAWCRDAPRLYSVLPNNMDSQLAPNNLQLHFAFVLCWQCSSCHAGTRRWCRDVA